MLSTRLKELRATKQISQADLSNILGVTQQAVGKWERDKTTPDYETLKKIASFFGVTTDYLLGNEPPKREYYHDPEVAAIAQEMHDNPEIKVLFHATKGMKKESIEEIRKFVEFQKAKENGFME
jgi:transcriptional regulator with XRE-family HTH domain